jgi:UDP-N-acetylglucosamine--N-acetylmuramyl-(pentapeptide) pyrophosphoryl-undecaprenol N-acetylglucosamine transferase
MIRAHHNGINILFAGGGTGGHLYPAIAIANRLAQLWNGSRPLEISFVGTRRGLEYRLGDKLGYPLHLINVRGLARSFTLKNLLVPFVLLVAMFKTSMILNKLKPTVVIGTGGYVALPVLKMAKVKKIACVVQEQNSFPGITTRRTAWYAERIYLGMPGAQEKIKTNGQMIVTGNPVRTDLVNGNREAGLARYNLDRSKKTILILGGSQGARGVNEAVKRSLLSGKFDNDYQLLWQTGKGAYKELSDAVSDKAQGHALFPFAENMSEIYAAADVAIARAGALTLAELQAVELPAILIPYPSAAGDHQRKNALDYKGQGLAEVIEEHQLDGLNLVDRAVQLHRSEQFDKMKTALKNKNAGNRPAVDLIAEDIMKLINEKISGEGN